MRRAFRRLLQRKSDKWGRKGRWRIPSIAYTLLHKEAFLKREKSLTGQNSLRGLLHDLDKPFLYCIPFLKDHHIQRIHARLQPHHLDSFQKKKVPHLIETYIDWECAPLTKPDKPLNAYATLLHFHANALALMLPVCLALSPYRVKPTVSDVLDCHKDIGVFQSKAYNRAMYNRVKTIIATILAELPDTLPKRLPHTNELTPTAIYIKTNQIIAQRQKHKINLERLRKTLTRVLKKFEDGDCFSKQKSVTVLNALHRRRVRFKHK